MTRWTLGTESGDLLLHTGVAGSAARMGHRLTIACASWRAVVNWDGAQPSAVEVTVDLESLQVLSGEGGLTPLSGAEKTLARSNAVKTLRANKFPQARFRCDEIGRDGEGYRLTGTLELAGRTGAQTVLVAADGPGRIAGEARVRHSDFGIRPYSMMMGAMKVADEVRVSLSVTRDDRWPQ
ncbi:YceI family protein [Mycobacterium sp. NPDC003449]